MQVETLFLAVLLKVAGACTPKKKMSKKQEKQATECNLIYIYIYLVVLTTCYTLHTVFAIWPQISVRSKNTVHKGTG